MFGAILGDIIGSRFEFDRGGKTKDFELITDECCFTDDTVMTIAVANAILCVGPEADDATFKNVLIQSMQHWANQYPNAGYGARFINWLFTKDPKPYGSYGNGSAMRVSPVGWLFDSMERTLEVARWSAEVSHNHPEGIKGAECTAAVIFLSRIGKTKTYIKNYVLDNFDYDFSESLDEMRNRHEHVETCMDSLPKALRSFFDGESYEDVVRNAVSLGGDTDTLAAIAGAMAEAYYGMPEDLKKRCIEMCPRGSEEVTETFISILDNFEELKVEPRFRRNNLIHILAEDVMKVISSDIDFDDKNNEKLLDSFTDDLNQLILEISLVANDGGTVFTPCIDVDNQLQGRNIDDVDLEEDINLYPDIFTNESDEAYIGIYTNRDEIADESSMDVVIKTDLKNIIKEAYKNENIQGILIDPDTVKLQFDRERLKILIDYMEEIEEC